MAAGARAALETLLRDRKLDTTLTTALPLDWDAAATCVPTGVPSLDTALRGGVPRGHVSEIVGPRSAGRTSVLRALIAEVTRAGELVALVDTLDRFDPASAAAGGVDLTRVLWVRGHDVPLSQQALEPGWEPSRPRAGRTRDSVVGRALDRAVKAVNLVLQAGGFGLVALDLADVPVDALRDLPFTTWMRLQRVVGGSDTACVIVADLPLARSAGGVSVRLQPHRTASDPSRDASMVVHPVSGQRSVLTGASPEESDARAGTEAEHEGCAGSLVTSCEVVRVGGRREGLASEAFHAAVQASRRPFTPRPASRGITGRWTGRASPLPRLRGLAADASIVRAQHQAHSATHVPLEFSEG
jgi:RecA DNA recombination protein